MAKQYPDDDKADHHLMVRLERWIGRLRGVVRKPRRATHPDLVQVRVGVIGETPATSPTASHNFTPDQDRDGALQKADQPVNPFLPSPREALSIQTRRGDDWVFNQPVLLKRQNRASSVLVWSAVGGFGAFLLWAFFAPLSETIAVMGKLQPSSKVNDIQAPVAGVIEEVLVEEGQVVNVGQELLRFDLRDARSKLEAAESVRSRLLNENQIYAAVLGDQSATGLTPNQRQQLSQKSEELSSRREAALQTLRQSEERLRGLRNSLSIASGIERRYASLVRSGAASELQLLDSRDKAQQLRSRISEEERQTARLRADLTNSEASPNADLRSRIEANLRQISDLDSQANQARLQIQYGVLRAASSGVVFDLAVRRGSVLTPTSPLLKLVPGDALEAKVYVPSKAIGFLVPGQAAEISLDTYPAQDYGYLQATVNRIGSDALTPDELKQALGTDMQGLYYPANLLIKKDSLKVGGRPVALIAGMSLTADIRLRQRTFAKMITGIFNDKRRELERLR